jgi:ubiquinone/menaquinone biosynthesis C-methylase UbiE
MSVPVFERVIVISKLQNCKRILDLGCGNGPYIPYLKKKAHEVIGLDLETARLTNAKKKSAQPVRADAFHLPFIDNSFDTVWASEVIEHTHSLNTFKEIERVASKKIVATMPNPKGPYFRRDPSHVLRYNLPTLKDFLHNRDWTYSINGLGLCLPFQFFPETARKIFVRLTWNHPQLSFNFLITGVFKPYNTSSR